MELAFILLVVLIAVGAILYAGFNSAKKPVPEEASVVAQPETDASPKA